jgi:DNA-binding NarL/FixJ family response regulator
MDKPIKVLIVDDHPQVRSSVRALLSLQKNIEVVGDARDGVEAIRLAGTLKPNVVLMDISLPRMDGLKAAAKLADQHPEIRVIMLSMHSDRKHVHDAYLAGVNGYLLKSLARELVPAVQQVAEGKKYYSADISSYVAELNKPRKVAPADFTRAITPRQREVLQFIAEGYTTREIAEKLQISVKTAETHRTQLMERLDIHQVAGLVRYAIRVGLVKADM